MKEKKNLIWWQIILCYAAASVVVALLAAMMSSLQSEQIMELIIGDIPAVLGNSFMLILWQKICKTRSSRTGIMLAVLTLSWMSYYGNGENAISIAIQLAISGTIYYFALLYGKTPKEIEEEKNRNPEPDQQVPVEIKQEKKVATQQINKVKIEKTVEVQENEALSIMQEAQIPKEEQKEDQKLTQQDRTETDHRLLDAESKMDKLQIKLRHLKIVCVTLAILSVCLSGLLYNKSLDYAEKSADYENQEEFLTTYKNLASSSLDILDYYIANARFVYKGNKYHHAYGCPDVSDKTEYWIHNKEYCEYLGYTKCETCEGSSAYTITSTYMKANGLL